MNCVHCQKLILEEEPFQCYWYNSEETVFKCPAYALCGDCVENDDIDDKYFVMSPYIDECRPCYEYGERKKQEHREELKTRTITKIIKENGSSYSVKFEGIKKPSWEKIEDLRECKNFDDENNKHLEIVKDNRLREEQKYLSRVKQQAYWVAKLSLGENIIHLK